MSDVNRCLPRLLNASQSLSGRRRSWRQWSVSCTTACRSGSLSTSPLWFVIIFTAPFPPVSTADLCYIPLPRCINHGSSLLNDLWLVVDVSFPWSFPDIKLVLWCLIIKNGVLFIPSVQFSFLFIPSANKMKNPLNEIGIHFRGGIKATVAGLILASSWQEKHTVWDLLCV